MKWEWGRDWRPWDGRCWFEGVFVATDGAWCRCEHKHRTREAATKCVATWAGSYSPDDGSLWVIQHQPARVEEVVGV